MPEVTRKTLIGIAGFVKVTVQIKTRNFTSIEKGRGFVADVKNNYHIAVERGLLNAIYKHLSKANVNVPETLGSGEVLNSFANKIKLRWKIIDAIAQYTIDRGSKLKRVNIEGMYFNQVIDRNGNVVYREEWSNVSIKEEIKKGEVEEEFIL